MMSKLIRFVSVLLLCVFVISAAVPVQAAAGGKRIIVSLSQQRLYAYQGNTLVFSAAVNAWGTARGTFRVRTKIYNAPSIYRGWWLPYWLGIYMVGRTENGIHGPATTAHGVTTASLGCVVLRSRANAAALFGWAPYGTPVIVRR